MAAQPLSDDAQEALKVFQDGCLQHHDEFVRKLKRRYDAYRGILDIASDAAQWTSKLHPPFINHIVETTLAGLVDSRLAFRVRPKPRLYEPGEYERLAAGAKAHEILHHCQLKADRFHEKLRPFALQDAIAGLTVAKTYWRRERAPKRRLVAEPIETYPGGPVLERLVEREVPEMSFDGPTTEVVNVEDFFWHEAAVDLQRSPVVAHRVYMTFPELKRLEQLGVYKNVDDLKETRPPGQELREVDSTDRAKDMHEVLEIWRFTAGGVKSVTLGNRSVELKAERANPFWHGEYPFVACSTRPDMFRIPGMSQVEKIAHLQEAHWDLENQTRDNVRLINNAIVMYRSDMDDPDALEFEPGARWPVEDPAQITMWSPDPIAANISLPHLSKLEQMMQNLAGSQPFTSTSEARGQGADTATEAALLTNLAQQATLKMKEQLNFAYERIGQQRTELNKQFVRQPMLAEKVGLDNAQEMVEIVPLVLQGDYLFDISPQNESLMRGEKRAEAAAIFQLFLQGVPVQAALAASGGATPLNADEFWRFVLENYDIQNPDRFFSNKPQPQAVAPPGSPPGAPPAADGPQQGVTNPALANSDLTQNPMAAQQQMAARVGGLQGG